MCISANGFTSVNNIYELNGVHKEALIRDLEYNLNLLEEKKRRLEYAIAVAEKEQDEELKTSTALEKCIAILENDRLIKFAHTGEEMLKRIANDGICAQDDMMERHLDKAVHLVQKLSHTDTEDVEMVGLNSDNSAERLRGTFSRLVATPQLGLGITNGDGSFEESAAQPLFDMGLLQSLLHRLSST